jgi:glycosyltransferase involved in cell wall biosynthesis
MHLEDKVRLTGGKNIADLADLYRNALLFVLSSNEEGLGIVVLEAMASGLAVVSTNCGGPVTAIVEGRTGLLTPVGDIKAFAQAIEQLLLDPASRQRMGIEGRKVVEQRFSLAEAGKIFLDTYDKILRGAAQPWTEPQNKHSVSVVAASADDWV